MLTAGDYFTHRPIVAYGFNGTLRGEGKKEIRIFGVGSEANPFKQLLKSYNKKIKPDILQIKMVSSLYMKNRTHIFGIQI